MTLEATRFRCLGAIFVIYELVSSSWQKALKWAPRQDFRQELARKAGRAPGCERFCAYIS